MAIIRGVNWYMKNISKIEKTIEKRKKKQKKGNKFEMKSSDKAAS